MPEISGKVLTSWSLVCLTSLYLLLVGFMEEVENGTSIEKKRDTRRPIWNLAHIVNRKEDVNKKIDDGANGIEFDVQFTAEGIANITKHACPSDMETDCEAQTEFVEYIKYMRKVTSPDATKHYRKKLVLLIMDLKLSKESSQSWKVAGRDVAEKLLEHYWQKGKTGAKAYIILCVPYYNQMDFITSFRETLNSSDNFDYYDTRIGYDFSGREDLDDIQSAFEKEGIDKNIWQSDGMTNWFLPYRTSTRIRECIERRESTTSYFQKVYWWTVDPELLMKQALWWGVDGIMTNIPSRVIEVLNSTIEFKRIFRLATLDDNPWEKFTYDFTD